MSRRFASFVETMIVVRGGIFGLFTYQIASLQTGRLFGTRSEEFHPFELHMKAKGVYSKNIRSFFQNTLCFEKIIPCFEKNTRCFRSSLAMYFSSIFCDFSHLFDCQMIVRISYFASTAPSHANNARKSPFLAFFGLRVVLNGTGLYQCSCLV